MMELILKPRQMGKTEDILRIAEQDFSYIVCPTHQDVDLLWRRAREQVNIIPQPITWHEFVHGHYNGRGIRSLVIDDLDRCIQGMTSVEINAVSMTYGTSTE